jgi:hypothetical protein
MMMRVLAVKGAILVLRVVLGLLDLLQRHAVRLVLGATVLTLLLHFTLNDPGLSSMILRKVSDILPGGIEASRIVWVPLTDEITILDVEIYRPGHNTVIAAKRVDASLRLGRLVVGALRSFLPFAPPIPLFFDRARVTDAQVTLEFRDRGLLLPEAFTEMEPDEDEPDEKEYGQGGAPDLRIRGIEVINAEVVLDFSQVWGLRAKGVSLSGAFYLKRGQPIVDVKDIFVARLSWLGELAAPPQLGFLFQTVKGVRVASYYLNTDSMEIGRVRVPIQEGELQVRGSIDAGDPAGVQFSAMAEMDITDASLLEQLTGGEASGVFQGRANISGHLEDVALELGIAAPWVWGRGLLLEEVSALLRWQVGDPLLLNLPHVQANSDLGFVEVFDLTLDLDQGVKAAGRVCVEDLDGVALAETLGLELGLWDGTRFTTEPVVGGCATGRVTLDEELRVEAEGSLQGFDQSPQVLAFLDNAFFAQFKGVYTAAGITLDQLQVVSGDDWAELKGRLEPENLRVNVAGDLFLAGLGPLGLLPPSLGLDQVELAGFQVCGTTGQPQFAAEIFAVGLRLPGLTLDTARARVDLAQGNLAVKGLCLTGETLKGCFDFAAPGLLDGLALSAGPWPLDLRALTPVDLDPWGLGLPLVSGGPLSLGRLEVRATLSDRFPFVQGPLALATELDWRLFSLGPMSMDRLGLTLETRCADTLDGGCDLAAWLQADGLQVGPVTSLRTILALQVQGLRPLGALAGNRDTGVFLTGRTSKVNVGPLPLKRSRFTLAMPPAADGSFMAAIRITTPLLLELSGALARADLSGRASVKFANLERGSLPMVWQKGSQFNLLDGAVVEGDLDLAWPALTDLLGTEPAAALWLVDISGMLRANNLLALPQPVSAAEVMFSLKRRQVEVRSLHVILADGLGVLDGTLSLNLASGALKGSLDTSLIPVHRLAPVARLAPPAKLELGINTKVWGTLASPEASGRLTIRRAQAAGIDLGDADLVFQGGLAGGLELHSETFFRKLELQRLMLRFAGLRPLSAEVDLGITDLEPSDFVRDLALPALARLSGQLHALVALDGSVPPQITLTVPAQGLDASSSDLEEDLWVRNSKPFVITGDGSSFETKCLTLDSPVGTVALWGKVDLQRGWEAFLGGEFELENYWLLNPYLSQSRVALELGGGATCGKAAKAVKVTGALANPEVSGRLVINRSMVQPRHYPQEIDVNSGVLLFSGTPVSGSFQVETADQKPLKGVLEEGDITLALKALFKDFLPVHVEARATGSNLFLKQANQFRMVLNPVLDLVLDNPLDPLTSSGTLKGELHVTEGEYYRNFDKLLGSFANAFSSRSQERYSRPLEEVLPFMKKLRMDLGIHFTGLHVTSRFPFGETDMEVSASLRIKGSLAEPELYDRLSIIPGGAITYKVVRRDFEIVAGYADFTGAADRPAVDIKAQTYVRYIPSEGYTGSISEDERRWGKDILINIHVYGQYPELSFELSSENSEFDQADLQTLLLLGMTRADLENRVGATGMSINILTDDMTDALSGVLLSAFVDDVSLGFTQEGGIKAETVTRVGRAIELDTRVEQDQTTSEYSAGFRFMLTDDIFLEGRMKMRQEELETYRNYEGRIRYRIPLE